MTNIDYKKDYKQELINLLKTQDEVRNAMEKLEFGCNILVHDSDGGSFGREKDFWYEGKIVDDGIVRYRFPHSDNPDDDEIFEYKLSYDDKIIGLPLQERFITMYLDKKIGEFNHYNVDYKGIFLHINDESIFIEIDKNKDYDNQTQETYKQIFLALKEM